jgi:hypothetical protein
MGTLQLSMRCSSIHFLPMRSFPVSDVPLTGLAVSGRDVVWSGGLSCAKVAVAKHATNSRLIQRRSIGSIVCPHESSDIRLNMPVLRSHPEPADRDSVDPHRIVRASRQQERQMKMKQLILAGCSILVLSAGTAMAGPCDTGRAASLKDAGSGPTRTGDSQTTGMVGNTDQHPPTGTMNKTTGDVAASSQDTQRQMQGEPTAAQQADGAKAGAKTGSKAAGNDC